MSYRDDDLHPNWRPDDGSFDLYAGRDDGGSSGISQAERRRRKLLDHIPDVRDGLTRVERVVLWQLWKLEKELGGRSVPTAMLYGRVVDHGINITPEQLSRLLGRLGAMKRNA